MKLTDATCFKVALVNFGSNELGQPRRMVPFDANVHGKKLARQARALWSTVVRTKLLQGLELAMRCNVAVHHILLNDSTWVSRLHGPPRANRPSTAPQTFGQK